MYIHLTSMENGPATVKLFWDCTGSDRPSRKCEGPNAFCCAVRPPPDAEISTFASAALFYSGCLSLVRVVFQMSKNTDSLPCRNAEWKYSSVPSNERDGFPSQNGLLITGPPCAGFTACEFAGVPHG